MILQVNQNESLWQKTETIPIFPTLFRDATSDVCVVGAGITGLTAAYFLAKAGKKVIVVSESTIGGGETGRTTAHLSNAIDCTYMEVERLHGQLGAQLAAQSHTFAVDTIEAICSNENILCDFERVEGYLFNSEATSAINLDDELSAVHRAGLTNVTLIENLKVGNFSFGPCLRYPEQAQFNPLKYILGLAHCVESMGVEIYTKCRVEKVTDDSPNVVHLQGNIRIEASAVIVATNSPILDKVALHTKQSAYRTYVHTYRLVDESLPKGLYWDTANPFHYIRTYAANGQRFLVVGGEDHRTGQLQDESMAFKKLELWAQRCFQNLGEPVSSWSGQILESVDGLAYIGHYPLQSKSVYVASGDSGMGMTHGTIAGRLLTDLIKGKENPWEKLYSPARLKLSALKEWTTENVNTMMQYTDYVKGSKLESGRDLAPGEAAVLGSGMDKIAAYRDINGTLVQLSARCTHLGGIVRWNNEEKTWDCPCHGSRFSPTGKVLNSPAVKDLQPCSQVIEQAQKVSVVESLATQTLQSGE